MKSDIYKKAIECIPTFFENRIQSNSLGAEIFEPLKSVIDFDEGYIFFMNPDSIRLKYIFAKERKHSADDLFRVDDKIKAELFSDKNLIITSKNPLVKLLCLENNHSFLILKLFIRDTVFGFILLAKNEKSYYTSDILEISTAIGSVISYCIKDIELSEIFKVQLKALKDGIIDTKRAYKTINEQNIKILEADKIKNDFLANVSHELRTPLNAIIGFSEILSNQLFGELNEKQKEYVEDILVSGIHLLGMINEILDIAKIEAHAVNLNRTEFLISQAVNEVVNIVKPLSDKKVISINTRINEGKVYADFQKVRQILYNLLSNAIKFSSENENISVNVYFNNGYVFLEVKDNGIGIAKNDQQKIFDKFVQLENAYTKKESSTGLGLTITKELTELHGGTITVDSDLNKGATFVVKIPFTKSFNLKTVKNKPKNSK